MRLECVIVARPPVTRVSWSHEKQELVHAPPHLTLEVSEPTQTPSGTQIVAALTLDAYSPADEAKYTCNAENDLGQKSTSCYIRTEAEGLLGL